MITLPAEKPDCCAACPLVGIIPKSMVPRGSFETRCCLGTHDAMTERFIRVKASARDKNHPLKRPCDDRWHAWMQLPRRKIGISTIAYLQCRIPYENSLQLSFNFKRKYTRWEDGTEAEPRCTEKDVEDTNQDINNNQNQRKDERENDE